MINQKVEPVISWDPYLKVIIKTSALPSSEVFFLFSIDYKLLNGRNLYVSSTSTMLMQGRSQFSTLKLRIPIWTNVSGAKAAINEENLKLPAPGVKL